MIWFKKFLLKCQLLNKTSEILLYPFFVIFFYFETWIELF